jgi:diadenosine tetraphosphatase ApaH/serine/threonine PP2A family protein phosphatase
VLALLYDVHGNLPALEAVLADARAEGAERFLLGGDYALFGAWPEATLERLEGLGGEWIRGNAERWSADPDDAPEVVRPAIAALREALGEARVARLAALPEAVVRDGVRYCHASPISDVRGFAAAPDPEDAELMGDAAERRVVIGHTHLQFVRPGPGAVEIVNPGSVGMPLDGDHRAAYALVAPDGALRMRRVAYDHAASAAAVRERLGAAGEPAARRIERARFEVDD